MFWKSLIYHRYCTVPKRIRVQGNLHTAGWKKWLKADIYTDWKTKREGRGLPLLLVSAGGGSQRSRHKKHGLSNTILPLGWKYKYVGYNTMQKCWKKLLKVFHRILSYLNSNIYKLRDLRINFQLDRIFSASYSEYRYSPGTNQLYRNQSKMSSSKNIDL